jgi:opacity protein-like surface antigen
VDNKNMPSVLVHCIITLAFVAIPIGSAAQQNNFRFEISLNPGALYSKVARTISPDSSDYVPGGPAGTLRILWHPDNILSIGLEAGYLRLSQLRVYADDVIPDQSAIVLYAIPVLGVAEIEVLGLDLSAMIGAYKYTVDLGSRGAKESSSQWETGMGLGLGKSLKLAEAFRVGLDLRYYHIPERDVHALSASLRIQYNLIY